MNHDETVLLLPDFATGKLSSEDHRNVAEHVRGCEECAGLVATYRQLTDGLERQANRIVTRHPTSEEIVAFALDPAEMGPEPRGRVSAHLEDCARCRHDASTVQDVERARERPASLWARITAGLSSMKATSLRPALAGAAVVVLLLAYPLGRYVVEKAELVSRVEELAGLNRERQDRIATLTTELDRVASDLGRLERGAGAFRLHMLRSSLRGTEGSPPLMLDPNLVLVALVFGPALPDRADPNGIHRIEVRGPDGTIVRSINTTLSQLRQTTMESDGVYPVELLASSLQPGRYELTQQDPGGTALIRLQFEVEGTE